MRLTLIAAQSLDGFITRHDTPGSDFTSEADKTFFRSALTAFDCCVMGGKTYRLARDTIRANLMPDRLRVVMTRTPAALADDAAPDRLEFTDLPAAQLVASLQTRGFKQCAVLGGSQVHSLFLDAGLIDEIWLTIEPMLFGSGTPLLASRSDIRLRLLARETLSADTLLLKYQVLR